MIPSGGQTAVVKKSLELLREIKLKIAILKKAYAVDRLLLYPDGKNIKAGISP